MTSGGTFYTLRCYLDDAPVFLGRNGRISVFGSERSLARYLADEHDHDLSDLATYDDIRTAATDGSLRVDVTDDNVYVTSGLADDLADGPDAIDRDQLELAVELLRDVGDYAEDDIVDETLDADSRSAGSSPTCSTPTPCANPARPMPRPSSSGKRSRRSSSPGCARSSSSGRQPVGKPSSGILAPKGAIGRMLSAQPWWTEMAMTGQQQQAMDSFYALDNVITIKITMPQDEWDKVRTEEPKGGRCELRMDRGRQIHMAQGDLGGDLRDQVSRADDVHRRRHQEEVVLRLDRRQQAVPAHRLRQVQQHHQRPRTRP